MILVPVKAFAEAKQRLAPVLDAEQRRLLSEAMLRDVLGALEGWRRRPRVAVVTGDAKAKELAGKYRFEVIEDRSERGETSAIELATRVALERKAKETLVIPGDVPLVTAAEVEEIFRVAPKEGAVLVPAADGRGTNAALRRPAGLFALRFGDDSFVPHVEAARRTGKGMVLLRLNGIALDVDRPEDLAELVKRPGGTRAQRLVRAWGMGTRVAAAMGR